MNKLPKVKASKGQIPKSLATDYEEPCFHKIATEIIADSEEFVPKYQTDNSSCVDLVANMAPNVHGNNEVALPHRATVVIDCGFSMAIPKGYVGMMSVNSKYGNRGLIVTDAPKTIDSDYRGRIQAIVTNVGKEIIVIKHGDKFAQMRIQPVYRFDWNKVSDLIGV